MSKCHKWFKNLIEALEKDPSWDIDFPENNSRSATDRTNPNQQRKKINNPIHVPKYKL